MPRLFTGLALPEPVRGALAKARQPLPGARWVDPSDLHLTLRFFGDLEKPAVRELKDSLASVTFQPFSLRLIGFGVFGGNEPRVLWAGVEPSPSLADLAQAIDRAARSAGLPPERHPFRAHITVARFRRTRLDAIVRFLEHQGGFRAGPIEIHSFHLYSSKPRTGGGPYVIEESYSFHGYELDIDPEDAWLDDPDGHSHIQGDQSWRRN